MTKRPFECISLDPSEKLVGVQREWHTRKVGAYIVVDRYGKFVLVSQRLPLIASFLNAMASDTAERVSVPALHQTVGKTQNRNCGYTKHRWRLSWCKLEDVGEHFENMRRDFEQAVILGAPSAYRIRTA